MFLDSDKYEGSSKYTKQRKGTRNVKKINEILHTVAQEGLIEKITSMVLLMCSHCIINYTHLMYAI